MNTTLSIPRLGGIVGITILGAWGVYALLIAPLVTLALPTTTKPHPPIQTVAIVDDDIDWALGLLDWAGIMSPGLKVQHFIFCEQLLAEMSVGMKFNAYVVDFVPADGSIFGHTCVQKILALHPSAMVIGSTAEDPGGRTEKAFRASGAKGFILKSAGGKKIIELILELLK